MFSRLKKLYQLLTITQKRKLMKLQILIVAMAFAELAGVVAIGPFMAVVGDISQLEGQGILAQLYDTSGLDAPEDFLFWLGALVLAGLTIAAMVSMYATWRLAIYAQQIGADLSIRIYKHYMKQSWLFHVSGSTSQLTNKIAQEATRVTDQVIQPLMQMNAKLILAMVMTTAMFLFNPKVALIGVLLFTTAYTILYRTVRLRLTRNGKVVSETNQLRFKLMNEGFGGIKDTLLLGRQEDFNRRFEKASIESGYARGVTRGLSQVPRYALELIAFSAVILLVLYLLAAYDSDLGQILPILSIYALAGFKLLPAFQQIYTSLAQVRGNISAFDNLEEDLIASQTDPECENIAVKAKLSPKTDIVLENVNFQFQGKENKALNNLTIRIPVNHVIGLVGTSGAGKSTAVDVLLGLLPPQAGCLKIDGQKLDLNALRGWQNNVGFVPQSIFLADTSIRENIAFGLPMEEIDEARVSRAASMAHLDELLVTLPHGLDTVVGERGIQLSGGQRQRIGIARALYDDAEVLVLDEATSALDGIAEKAVMDAIHDFAGRKTVVMIAHRLATVKKCDTIFLIKDGRVDDSGSYEELAARNVLFKEMVEHA